jgi:hypothetical protein
MMTPVTIAYGQRSVADATQAILDEVKKTAGISIAIGSLPFWPTDLVNFGSSGETAREALARLFSATGKGQFSYRLAFDPRPDTMRFFDYMINIQRSGSAGPTTPTVLTNPPVVISPPPAYPSPGFVKPN